MELFQNATTIQETKLGTTETCIQFNSSITTINSVPDYKNNSHLTSSVNAFHSNSNNLNNSNLYVFIRLVVVKMEFFPNGRCRPRRSRNDRNLYSIFCLLKP